MSSVPNHTSSVSQHPTTFNVAIVGGGIGGLCLALGLLRYPHIDVHVYEAAPSFGEIGAGVALGPNSQRALELISPKAIEAMRKHVTGNMWPTHANSYMSYIVGVGEHEGKHIYTQNNSTGMQSVHRAHFLDELVKAVPGQRAHFNKRLAGIEDNPGQPVLLRFKDGTTATTDAVVGYDGIHSTVRTYLIGEEAAKPVYSGVSIYRGLIPMDAAVEKLGAEYAQNSFMLVGPGKAILSYPIDHGKVLNVAAMDYDRREWEHEHWIVPSKHDEIRQVYPGWGKTGQGFVELLDTPDLATWALFDTKAAPFYYKSRVCIAGDAAHASTPFQAQGAGQAIEDALVLTELLAKVEDKKQIPNAFAAYDQIRRPRTQRLVRTNKESGELMSMRLEGVGADLHKMAEKLSTRMHWIWHRNLVKQNEEAIELFEESL